MGLPSFQDSFHACMREVDALIKHGNFEGARKRLSEARQLAPSSPYIVAFEERIKIFEKRQKDGKEPQHPAAVPKTPAPAAQKTSPPAAQKSTPPAEPSQDQNVEVSVASRQIDEKKLREQIEMEYRQRFTEELKNAELGATKALEEERLKFERARASFESEYEHRLADVRQQAETDYRKKLEEEIAGAEERLRRQFDVEQSFFENEIKSQLVRHYDLQQRELEEKMRRSQEELLEHERAAFQEKEGMTKGEFNRKLLEELHKIESVFHQQSVEKQQLEQQRMRDELTRSFEEKLSRERASYEKRYDALQQQSKEAHEKEKKRIEEEFQNKVDEQVQQARRRQAQEYEKNRSQLLRDLEVKRRTEFQGLIETESRRILEEADKAIEDEQKKLRVERETMLREENEKLQGVRLELEQEMEAILSERLEQQAKEYNRKMELLGIATPKTKEDCLALYREKLKVSYADGEPTVDEIKKILELKGLLDLNYDEHMQVEADVRKELYVQHVQKGILSGTLSLADSPKLDALRKKFNITASESSLLEPYVLSRVRQRSAKGKILVADDEAEIRESLADELVAKGYEVVRCESVKEALDKLRTEEVDLVISDINFLPREPDGFMFFKAVQELPRLRRIPFIFLSALADDASVRTGMQLGIDDYLTKPVDVDFLLAVIEGKLKRSRLVEQN